MEYKSMDSFNSERLRMLEVCFQNSIQVIIQDPIMECFRQNTESRQFMFDRMKEIINESMSQANDEYIKEILERMDHMNIFSKSLKDEVINLTSLNQKMSQEFETAKQRSLEQANLDLEKQKLKVEDLKSKMKKESIEKYELIQNIEQFQQKLALLEGNIKENEELSGTQDNVIDSLKQKIESKEFEVQELIDKNNFLIQKADKFEKQMQEKEIFLDNSKKTIEQNYQMLKQSNVDKDIQLQDLKSQINLFIQEKELLQSQIQSLKKKNAGLSDNSRFKRVISEQEEQIKSLKKELKKNSSSNDDIEFINSQLQKTITNLKSELQELSKKMGEERRTKHQMEIKIIETKDQLSKIFLKNRCLEDDYEKAAQELTYVQNQLELKDEDLKNERRKAAYLEREFDQFKFSSDSKTEEMEADFKNMLEKIQYLEQENKEVQLRIDELIKEHQKRIEDERTSHNKTKLE